MKEFKVEKIQENNLGNRLNELISMGYEISNIFNHGQRWSSQDLFTVLYFKEK